MIVKLSSGRGKPADRLWLSETIKLQILFSYHFYVMNRTLAR
jgi:hypothetical protein